MSAGGDFYDRPICTHQREGYIDRRDTSCEVGGEGQLVASVVL